MHCFIVFMEHAQDRAACLALALQALAQMIVSSSSARCLLFICGG